MSMPKGSCQLPEAARKVARLEARNQQLKDQVARLRAELRDVQRAHKREAARLEAEVTAELSRKELDVAKSAADFALRAKAVAERGN